MGVMRLRTLLAVVALVVLAVSGTAARQIWAGGYGRFPPKFATPTTFCGGFNFCRLMFQSDHREKQGWGTDYPGADINFSIRLGELTKTQIKMTNNGEGDEPDTVVVRASDDALFQCPFILMEDAGTAKFSAIEIERLREYLLKGGFLLASDYHGTYAKEHFDEEIARALPPGRYPIIDIDPPNHVMWSTMFDVKSLPQMASIQTWRRTGDTIERWNENGGPPTARAIADERGRLMVVMIHDTDLPDPWEREGEDKDYFYRFSPDAYAVGIDIMLYAMSH